MPVELVFDSTKCNECDSKQNTRTLKLKQLHGIQPTFSLYVCAIVTCQHIICEINSQKCFDSFHIYTVITVIHSSSRQPVETDIRLKLYK